MKQKRHNQPRIKGIHRDPTYSGLLPVVKQGIRHIARTEHKSVSRVMASIISDWFGISAETGDYVNERKKNQRMKVA